MIKFSDLYCVLCAVVPLYVTMFLAYSSVKFWQIFTPQQCSGINRFVAIFAVPLLSFEFISRINPYKMNFLFIAADVASKVLVLLALFLWVRFSHRGSIEWAITIFSLSTLPNSLVMGIPLLKSMYGDDKEGLMIQTVAMQCIIWYTLLLFLFEYRAAKILIMQKLEGMVSESKTERSEERTAIQKAGVDEEVVHVIVTRPAAATAGNLEQADPDPQRLSKVGPTSARFKPAEEDGKELHLFIWRCGCCNSEGFCEMQVCNREEENATEKGEKDEKAENVKATDTSSSLSSEMMRKILKMVWYRLVRNPNSYASLVGVTWALLSCRWGFKKPQILDNSVTILSNAGLGMAMFSLGLFMALQPRIIACGTRLAAYGMLARFIASPIVMAVASFAVGLRGTVLRVAIVQAALPQGIVPFVFAREYNLHPDVLSTAVIFGMIVSLPITILYYILLGL